MAMLRDSFVSDRAGSDLKRMIRLIQLLDAAENAGMTPMPVSQLHSLAYLSNVLSPVWDMPVADGKILKRQASPFYPSLQSDLDRLVGLGIALASGISHVLDQDKQWRIEGAFRLNRDFANPILQRVTAFEDEQRTIGFLQELAYAVSALGESELARAFSEDATYADPMVDVGNVVDFGEWRALNYSANAARHFKSVPPQGVRATEGELLHLYIHHLHGRLNPA